MSRGIFGSIQTGASLGAAIVSLDEELKTPAGTFKCVHVKETTPLEKDVSHKWYAPGVGLVKDDGFVLTSSGKP